MKYYEQGSDAKHFTCKGKNVSFDTKDDIFYKLGYVF